MAVRTTAEGLDRVTPGTLARVCVGHAPPPADGSLPGPLAEIVTEPPASAHGELIGSGGWRLAVEVLLPGLGTLWGVAEWGNDQWDALSRQDLTPWVRGISWRRGADEPGGRPRPGVCDITLESPDGLFSPWSPAGFASVGPGYFAPGTTVRVGIHDPADTRCDGWVPLFCGTVESWSPRWAGVGADQYVSVSLIETGSLLAQIDDPALSSPVGTGEGTLPRVRRLLEAAGWPYGLLYTAAGLVDAANPDSVAPLQGTTVSGNRLTELYLAADSADLEVYTDRRGALLIADRWHDQTDTGRQLQAVSRDENGGPLLELAPTGDTTGELVAADYTADGFGTGNTDERIRNDIRLARAGGTAQTATNLASVARFGRRSWSRFDLIATTDAAVAVIADALLDRWSRTTITGEAIELDVMRPATDTRRVLALAALDIGDRVEVRPPSSTTSDDPFIAGVIRSIAHQITPGSPGPARWTLTVAVDTDTLENLPGGTTA